MLQSLVSNARDWGQTIALTGGIYDVLHIGHLHHLQEAKSYADFLIVEMGDDALAREAKGPGRPVTPVDRRAELVAALKPVDCVVIVTSMDFKWEVIRMIRPDFYVRGGDYLDKEVPERQLVESLGGIVVFTSAKVESATDVIARLREARV